MHEITHAPRQQVVRLSGRKNMANITMNTKTQIITVYAGFGKKADGTWRKVTASQNSLDKAKELLEEFKSDVKHFPDVYAHYEDYRIQKRTEITVIEEWQDV